MKTYTLNQVQNKLLGKIGTNERDLFENELLRDLNEKAINKNKKNDASKKKDSAK